MLYTGKFNVANVSGNDNGEPDHMVYYVDQDWRLPIASLYLNHEGVNAKKQPTIAAAFWVRGARDAFKPYFLYEGKEVGKMMMEGDQEMGAASADPDTYSSTDVTFPIDKSKLPQGAVWQLIVCKFPNIFASTSDVAFETAAARNRQTSHPSGQSWELRNQGPPGWQAVTID